MLLSPQMPEEFGIFSLSPPGKQPQQVPIGNSFVLQA